MYNDVCWAYGTKHVHSRGANKNINKAEYSADSQNESHQSSQPSSCASLISHQWRPRGNLQHDHWMTEHFWNTWWRITTGKWRDDILPNPWHGYTVGPIWSRGGISVVCRWWSRLCLNHQWERWLGWWMKHAQLLSLVARTDVAWGFMMTVDGFRLGVLIRHGEFMLYSDKPG